MKRKAAIITSHPIQYNAPMFALLNNDKELDIKVFYTWSQSRESLFDKDFGRVIEWDIPLLEGYPYEFIENLSKTPGPGSYKGIICPELNGRIASWGADALLVYGWNYHAHYNAMKYFKGKIPVFFRGDSTLLDETGGIRQAARRAVLRFIYRSADYAFYVGENNRNYYLSHGFAPDKLFFAPHAIDNRRFSDPDGSKASEAAAWRQQLGIEAHEAVVLFVGKFEPKKNPDILLRAARLLTGNIIHFIFAGNGMLEKEMIEMAAGLPGIHFIPFQNQSKMPIVYRLADLLALPSAGPGETWGLAVNEAMACGKAVLVSNKCGCAIDLVVPGKNGFIMEAGNTNQCAEFLLQMTRSKDILQGMGAFSASHIASWSFEAVCNSFRENIMKY